MCGHIKMHRIRYKVIRGEARMIPLEDNITKARHKLFGDVKKSTNVPTGSVRR